MSIPEEKKFMLRHYAQEGVPKARIARQFGVSRQSVYNCLKEGSPRLPSAKKGKSILDPYKAYIRSRLEKYDLTAEQLFKEIQRQGYPGGRTIVKDYVNTVKQNHIQKLTERYETGPGEQAQMDWGECGTIDEGGTRKKLYVLTLVLGYSRMMYARFTTSMSQPVLLQGLQSAFQQLGIPKEILFDNMKQVVISHGVGEDAVFNRKFLDFSGHYGFVPVAAPPYWPRVKGKVESGVKYVKRSFLEGREFIDLVDLNDQMENWLQGEAHVRNHGTTHQRPIDRYQEEAALLRPFRSVPHYDTSEAHIRKVANDSHISFEAVRYSVHPQAVGQSVSVKMAGDDLSIYLGTELVGQHKCQPKGSQMVTLPSHRTAIRAITRMMSRGAVRKRAPRFAQQLPEVSSRPSLEWAYSLAPLEIPELKIYDQLLEVLS